MISDVYIFYCQIYVTNSWRKTLEELILKVYLKKLLSVLDCVFFYGWNIWNRLVCYTCNGILIHFILSFHHVSKIIAFWKSWVIVVLLCINMIVYSIERLFDQFCVISLYIFDIWYVPVYTCLLLYYINIAT